MPNIVIVGAQWGDEGKGARSSTCSRRRSRSWPATTAATTPATRIQRRQARRFVLHLIPSGILHPGILCVMGNGWSSIPGRLEKRDRRAVARAAWSVEDNLVISDRAHLILPHHRALEAMAEEARGARKIGTTLRGIGPAYEDKAGRRGPARGATSCARSVMPAKLDRGAAAVTRRSAPRLRGGSRTID